MHKGDTQRTERVTNKSNGGDRRDSGAHNIYLGNTTREEDEDDSIFFCWHFWEVGTHENPEREEKLMKQTRGDGGTTKKVDLVCFLVTFHRSVLSPALDEPPGASRSGSLPPERKSTFSNKKMKMMSDHSRKDTKDTVQRSSFQKGKKGAGGKGEGGKGMGKGQQAEEENNGFPLRGIGEHICRNSRKMTGFLLRKGLLGRDGQHLYRGPSMDPDFHDWASCRGVAQYVVKRTPGMTPAGVMYQISHDTGTYLGGLSEIRDEPFG